MQIIRPSCEIMTPINGVEILKFLEKVGRTCYKSEEKITEDSYIPFITKLVERKHETMLEHFSLTIKFICDRGVSHELVRHRIASFAQESTRYCNYGKKNELTFIDPRKAFNWADDSVEFLVWKSRMEDAETTYLNLVGVDINMPPQEARDILPNSLKTEIVVTTNLREWMHIIDLRAAPTAHPQMRELMMPLLVDLYTNIPIIFNRSYEKYCTTNA